MVVVVAVVVVAVFVVVVTPDGAEVLVLVAPPLSRTLLRTYWALFSQAMLPTGAPFVPGKGWLRPVPFGMTSKSKQDL